VIVSFKGKIKLRIHPIECGKMAAFPALKTFAEQVDNDLRAFVKYFMNASLYLWMLNRYIPSHN